MESFQDFCRKTEKDRQKNNLKAGSPHIKPTEDRSSCIPSLTPTHGNLENDH